MVLPTDQRHLCLQHNQPINCSWCTPPCLNPCTSLYFLQCLQKNRATAPVPLIDINPQGPCSPAVQLLPASFMHASNFSKASLPCAPSPTQTPAHTPEAGHPSRMPRSFHACAHQHSNQMTQRLRVPAAAGLVQASAQCA